MAVTSLSLPREVEQLRTMREFAASGEARRLRVAARLSQSEVAAACGTTPSAVSRWESGERIPYATGERRCREPRDGGGGSIGAWTERESGTESVARGVAVGFRRRFVRLRDEAVGRIADLFHVVSVVELEFRQNLRDCLIVELDGCKVWVNAVSFRVQIL
jgi:hypothetical protein